MRLFEALTGKVRPRTESIPPGPSPTGSKAASSTPGPEAGVRSASAGTARAPAAPASVPSAPPARQVDWRVLFVGCDEAWFRQIVEHVLELQPGWLCERAAAFAEAEQALKAAAYGGLVVDGGTPDVDSLLNEMEANSANKVCLVRCDTSDRITVAHWNRQGIAPVSFEADAPALVANLKRLERLRCWMAEPAVKKLLPLIRKLPTAPELHARVTEQLQFPNASIQTLALLISQDPVMSAKILQVANSAFFGLAQEVTDTAEAVIVLGTERVRSLILLAGVFSQFGDSKCAGFSPEPIWRHSLQAAMFARAIAFGEMKDARMAETAFTAGLLHDIGKLVLAGNVPQMYSAVWRMQVDKKVSQMEAEQMMLGTTHAELGACLLGTWGLPLPILEAIAWHHQPTKSTDKGFSLLAAVHAANVFSHECEESGATGAKAAISVEYLLRAGLGDCRDRWRELCGIAKMVGSGPQEKRLRQGGAG